MCVKPRAVSTLHTRLSQRTKSPGSPTLLVLTSAALRTADMTRALKSTVSRARIPPTTIVPRTDKRTTSHTDKSTTSPANSAKPGTSASASDNEKEGSSISLLTPKSGEVAKLFAKHFKLEDHVRYLSKTKVGAAVGTPGRVGKLLCETGSSLLFPPIPEHFVRSFVRSSLPIPPSHPHSPNSQSLDSACVVSDLASTPPAALRTPALSHILLDTTHTDAKQRSLLDIPETRDEVFRVFGAPGVREGVREGRIGVVLF